MWDELHQLTPKEQALMLAWQPQPCTPATIEEAWAQLQSVPSYVERHQRKAAERETEELEEDFLMFDAGIR